MATRLGSESLIVFSGHLGHLKEADQIMDFTCEENVCHQTQRILEIFDLVKHHNPDRIDQLKFSLCAHSCGAFFILEAAICLLDKQPSLKRHLSLIFYCGTIVEFGSIGKFKALIAASPTGVTLMKRLKKSNWMRRRTQESAFLRQLEAEFTETFLCNFSTLAKEGLKELPTNRFERIKEIWNVRGHTHTQTHRHTDTHTHTHTALNTNFLLVCLI
eukprot:Blabericola_migrator_1__5652@NODE_286_length_10380_cov_74_401920_g236_i0_p4_GENE_NODE_286_length_10380_cov_74_401920_g236_i0NODE_286_length_10380_cov_74_401920_g236_i0_p4_ORF_typecomplete_len216_score39_48LIDHydrolase/PF10230_9/0_0003Abhydrolase_3/PF07859_13/0_046Hydrolase_4/PF12146_8/0_083DUF676/PF05057_14/0_13DUF676/PF05057_14/2_1e03_NODE_286_length_10380_cov_74_401920_g236_i0949310140